MCFLNKGRSLVSIHYRSLSLVGDGWRATEVQSGCYLLGLRFVCIARSGSVLKANLKKTPQHCLEKMTEIVWT